MLVDVLVKNAANHYEKGDVIAINPTGYTWSTGALQSDVFTVLSSIELSDSEQQILMMTDTQINLPKSMLHINALRKKLISLENMQDTRRRRYTLLNKKMERK